MGGDSKMVIINKSRYLERRVTKNLMRNWWYPVYNSKGQLVISLNQVVLPKDFEGKKLKFKLEIIDKDNPEKQVSIEYDGKKD